MNISIGKPLNSLNSLKKDKTRLCISQQACESVISSSIIDIDYFAFRNLGKLSIRNIVLVLSLVAIIVFGSVDAQAASEFYVRAGASGAKNGLNWNDAFTQLPSTLQRGATYYTADGNYPRYTFDDATDGSTFITIKKATASDHGTETGWSSNYGDGQATFQTSLTFSTAYWKLNGVTRDEDDWFDADSYGFKINSTNNSQQIFICSSNVEIYYTYVEGPTEVSQAVAAYAITTDCGSTGTGIIISRCYVTYASNHYFVRGSNGAIIEYCASQYAWSNGNNHGEVVNLYHYFGPCDDTIIRYNHFKNNFASGVGTADIAVVSADNIQIYGNIFENNKNSDGTVGWTGTRPGYEVTNLKFYNNTIIGEPGYASGVMLENNSSGSIVKNNLWIANTPSFAGVDTHSHDGFSSGSPSGSNAQTSLPTSIFTDYDGGDYTLNGTGNVIDNGTALTTDGYIDYDLLGADRDADSGWDIGAYNYTTNIILMPPQNLRIHMSE